MGIMARFPRSEEAPTKAEVNNWPFPQWSKRPRQALSHEVDGEIEYAPHGLPHSFPMRNYEAPTSAEVHGWPFPQYS